MKNLTIVAVAALMSLSSAAYAVDANVKAGVAGSAAAGTTAASADATATGSVSTENYGTLVSTLNAGKGTVDLSAVSADADIAIVSLSSLKANGNTNALDNALEKNKATLGTLHASITANAALKAKLEAQGVMVDSVVAVTTAADGKVTVFVDDRG
ncbi:MAG: hypothetical protein EON59_10860 [Alphaproteobacteria bacterium]|nr:MAG: hypothetical protein EON59_10860 [Alphaproteobacteria bacterium]